MSPNDWGISTPENRFDDDDQEVIKHSAAVHLQNANVITLSLYEAGYHEAKATAMSDFALRRIACRYAVHTKKHEVGDNRPDWEEIKSEILQAMADELETAFNFYYQPHERGPQ